MQDLKANRTNKNAEPTLDGLFGEPIVKLAIQSSRMEQQEVRSLCEQVLNKRGTSTGRSL